MSKVSVITVNYGQQEVTAELLKSINRHAPIANVEVIVVDNGSKEDIQAALCEICPEVVYVRSEQNLGFAGGNNLGITYATGDYLLFLNNDTEITADFIDQLCSELDQHPEIGLLSPLILFFEDKTSIQYAGYTAMSYLTGRNHGIAFMETDSGQYDTITKTTGFCHGAAMICRRSDLDTVGLMDERYFLYYEELDWCERFKRAGKQTGFTGKAKVYHKESISVGKESPLKIYFMIRNRWLFIRRNTGYINTMVFSLYYLLVVAPRLTLRYGIQRRPDLVKAVWEGIRWNITHHANSKDLGIKIPIS